jgi:hypothetical protein
MMCDAGTSLVLEEVNTQIHFIQTMASLYGVLYRVCVQYIAVGLSPEWQEWLKPRDEVSYLRGYQSFAPRHPCNTSLVPLTLPVSVPVHWQCWWRLRLFDLHCRQQCTNDAQAHLRLQVEVDHSHARASGVLFLLYL